MASVTRAVGTLHRQARASPYPRSQVQRRQVPDDKVSWLVEWPEYEPVEYTAAAVLAGPSWADPPMGHEGFCPKFNERDGPVDRRSHDGPYAVEDGRPRNPAGRTGLAGRGLLGRWGPNHAADPVVTRWKRDEAGGKVAHPVSGKNILQLVAVLRKDCGEWALPGGMVDPGEDAGAALRREFAEEATHALGGAPEPPLRRLFSQEPLPVYRGYVDDPRNTDSAWMETHADNYHDETGDALRGLALEAGDDAGAVSWVEVSDRLRLYASHARFVELVARARGAHWSQA